MRAAQFRRGENTRSRANRKRQTNSHVKGKPQTWLFLVYGRFMSQVVVVLEVFKSKYCTGAKV